MDDQGNPNPAPVETLDVGTEDAPESVVIRSNAAAAIGRAAGAATALATAALIIAAASILTMSAASEIGDAKVYSSRGFNNLEAIRWAAGTRLVVAGVAVLLAVAAGMRYARGLPATRYTFSADGEEAVESIEGAEPPGWVRLLVGAGMIVSVLAVVLNGVALAFAFHLHESPNFGLPG